MEALHFILGSQEDATTQADYREALKYGKLFFEELNELRKARLHNYAQQQYDGAVRTAYSLLNKNLDYSYPEGCEGAARMQHWLEKVTAYAPSQQVLALYNSPSSPTTPLITPVKGRAIKILADPWAGLLREGFTTTQLDNMLVQVGMINSATDLRATDEAKPRTWVAVLEALRTTKILTGGARKAEAQALYSRYKKIDGKEIASMRSLQRSDISNADARSVFQRACIWLQKMI